jgi:hypothetical protein
MQMSEVGAHFVEEEGYAVRGDPDADEVLRSAEAFERARPMPITSERHAATVDVEHGHGGGVRCAVIGDRGLEDRPDTVGLAGEGADRRLAIAVNWSNA